MRNPRRMLLLALLAALAAGCAPGQADPARLEAPPAPELGVREKPAWGAALRPTPAPRPRPEPEPVPEPADEEMVDVLDYIPDLFVELKYATADNFTGQIIYDFTEARLRYGTVKKLAAVQAALAEQGYGLRIWDAWRPASAQFALWKVCPDPMYVADPNRGFSSHSRGNTVDVTLTFSDGTAVEMPTGFDDFSALADRDYSDVPEPAKSNALLLENAMKEQGFRCYAGEWWHFTDEQTYPVAE